MTLADLHIVVVTSGWAPEEDAEKPGNNERAEQPVTEEL